jgi:hypothetical protein
LRLSRAALLSKLETTSDPYEIAFLQGQCRQLRIQEMLPEEIERLDEMLLKGEEYLAMKKDNDAAVDQ